MGPGIDRPYLYINLGDNDSIVVKPTPLFYGTPLVHFHHKKNERHFRIDQIFLFTHRCLLPLKESGRGDNKAPNLKIKRNLSNRVSTLALIMSHDPENRLLPCSPSKPKHCFTFTSLF